MDPRADHVHYAMSVALALSGDGSGAYDSLRRAIELQPRNRMLARQDSDSMKLPTSRGSAGCFIRGGDPGSKREDRRGGNARRAAL